MIDMNVIVAKKKKWLELEFCWWGWSQVHKWRWNKTHIDLGPLSIYRIKRPYLWLPLAWLIKPLRIWYHRRYVYTLNNKLWDLFSEGERTHIFSKRRKENGKT